MDSSNKRRLLDKFLEVFAKCGIEKTSMRMLCKEAKINPNTLYQIFSGKEEIIWKCSVYVVQKIESELRFKVEEYKGDIIALGEIFFSTFQAYNNEIRFCIQVMTSPNLHLNQMRKYFEQNVRIWSDGIADRFGVDHDFFEINFRLFLSLVYYYSVTGDEEGTKKQRYALYEATIRMSQKNKVKE